MTHPKNAEYQAEYRAVREKGAGHDEAFRGVLARVLDGSWQWETERRYSVATLFPGRHPAVALAGAGLDPILHRTFAFDEAAAAYACLHSGTHVGKVAIRVS